MINCHSHDMIRMKKFSPLSYSIRIKRIYSCEYLTFWYLTFSWVFSNCNWSTQIVHLGIWPSLLRSVLLYLGHSNAASRHLPKPSWERLLGYFSINRANGEWKGRIEKNIQVLLQFNCKDQWHFQVTPQLLLGNSTSHLLARILIFLYVVYYVIQSSPE